MAERCAALEAEQLGLWTQLQEQEIERLELAEAAERERQLHTEQVRPLPTFQPPSLTTSQPLQSPALELCAIVPAQSLLPGTGIAYPGFSLHSAWE